MKRRKVFISKWWRTAGLVTCDLIRYDGEGVRVKNPSGRIVYVGAKHWHRNIKTADETIKKIIDEDLFRYSIFVTKWWRSSGIVECQYVRFVSGGIRVLRSNGDIVTVGDQHWHLNMQAAEKFIKSIRARHAAGASVYITKWWRTSGIVECRAVKCEGDGVFVLNSNGECTYVGPNHWHHQKEAAQKMFEKLNSKKSKEYNYV